MTNTIRVNTVASWSFRLAVAAHLLSLAWIFFFKASSEASLAQVVYLSALMMLIAAAFITVMASRAEPGRSKRPDVLLAAVWFGVMVFLSLYPVRTIVYGRP